MTNTVREAYRIVLNDILNRDCGLLLGKYDAKNGNPQFMYGVQMVMEYIGYEVSEAEGDAISELFINNMIESQKKAREEEKEELPWDE